MTSNERADVLDDQEGWNYELYKSEVEKPKEKNNWRGSSRLDCDWEGK
jgi:hypothetical protein